MSQNDELYKGLFAIDEKMSVKDIVNAIERSNIKEGMYQKLYWMRLIISVTARLSLIASIWLFIYDYHYWYGIPLFFIVTLLVGGVRDRDIIKVPQTNVKGK